MANELEELKESNDINTQKELESILEDPEIPKAKKEKILHAFLGISVRKASSFSGPIPPPEVLKGYNSIIKDGAERIIAMAEKQSAHRMQLEDHAIKEELKQSRLGQIFGFTIGLTGMVIAAVLAILGHEATAGIFGTTLIIGLVAVFVHGKRLQQKDMSNKK